MADFPGVDYRRGLVGNGFSELDNCSHVDRDVLRRRPGYGRTANLDGRVASPYSGRIAVQCPDGILRLVDPATFADSAIVTVGTALGTFARYNGRLYFTNGSTGPWVLDSTTSGARVPGITAPAGTIGAGTVTASAGQIIAGAHLFRYRYKNAATGYLSNPSGAISKTLALNDRVTFSIADSVGDIIRPAGVWADRIVIEATLANGAEFYAAYEVAASATTLNFDYNDINISARTPALVYGDDGHNPMPQFNLLVEHRGRLFGVQESTRLLGWSRPGYPESWDLTIYARKLAQMEANDTVVGAASFLGDLYLFNPYGMSRFTYADDPTLGTVLGIPTDKGLWNQRCLVAVNNILYGFGPGGVWFIRAMNPEPLSIEMDPFIEATMDPAQAEDCFGQYNQEDKSITWFFTALGDTEPKRAITYSITARKWSTRTYKHGIIGAVYAYQKNYLFANGYMWREYLDYLDGCNGVVTATASAPSTTTVATVETMTDQIGGHLTFGTQTRLITGWAANSLTIDSAFVPAMVVGDVAFVGAAPVVAESQWIADPGLQETKNFCYLLMEFEPAQSDRAYSLQVFNDFSASPDALTRDTADTPPAGISYLNGDTAIRIAADGGTGRGYVPVPMSADYNRCLKIRFVAAEPTVPFGLISLKLAKSEDTKGVKGIGE